MPTPAGYTITMRPDLGEPTRTVTYADAIDWYLDDDCNLHVRHGDGRSAAFAAGQWASIEPVQAGEAA